VRWGVIGVLLIIFIIIKNEDLSYWISFYLRKISNQSTRLANYQDLIWIGYSYVAFRMLHTIIDSRRNNGLVVTLRDYLNYLFYFPAYIAGPIDRIDHFQKELEYSNHSITEDMIIAGERIAVGLFQKFILADTLAIISLNERLANQIASSTWMWFVAIMYTFRIYFDFSGYSHLAIGISRMIGINLPENFNRPLRAPTLTMFWNSWHITLTQWFRGYYFNPLSRWIRKKKLKIHSQIIMGMMQVSTMVLIGLWHGIHINFVIWGLWNGFGLFFQNKVSGYLTRKFGNGNSLWQNSKMIKAIATIFTFIFISLGWVWFALPNPEMSIKVFKTLFGLS